MAEGATPFEAWHFPSHRMLQRGLARADAVGEEEQSIAARMW
jgi:hypothetical protein